MRIDTILSAGTAGTGLGGALVAQATQSPEVTFGAIILAAIGLCSLWVRAHYAHLQAKLDVVRLQTQLEVYRRLCAKQHRCPFTPDGTPACSEPDQVDRAADAGGPAAIARDDDDAGILDDEDADVSPRNPRHL